MSNGAIIGISVAVVIVVALIAFLCWYFLVKKKKQPSKPIESIPATPLTPATPVEETIQLTAVGLLDGSSLFGYETEEELKARLDKLSKEEFKALNVEDYPLDKEGWNKLAQDAGENAGAVVEARNKFEMSTFFAYDHEKNLKPNANIICRTFKNI